MTQETRGRLDIEDRGAMLIVRIDGGPRGLFGLKLAEQLEELVDRVDRDPGVRAVVFTGRIPSGSSAMPTCPGCKKKAPMSHRWADAAPPRLPARPEARNELAY